MEKCTKAGNCIVAMSPSMKPQNSNYSYAKIYCYANEDMMKQCRRYQFSESVGSCPDFLLPDMKITDKDILVRMKN